MAVTRESEPGDATGRSGTSTGNSGTPAWCGPATTDARSSISTRRKPPNHQSAPYRQEINQTPLSPTLPSTHHKNKSTHLVSSEAAFKLDSLSLSGSSLPRRGPGAAGGRARGGTEEPPTLLPPPPLPRLAPGSLTPTPTSDDTADGREGRRTEPVPLPPEVDEVAEPRAALAAAAWAWASASAACIVEKAVEIGTPGAWKHPFTNVPTAWSTTL